jgi:hypothetical protein
MIVTTLYRINRIREIFVSGLVVLMECACILIIDITFRIEYVYYNHLPPVAMGHFLLR